MGDSALKSVIVMLDTQEVEDSDDNFEIDFCNDNGKLSDLTVIKRKLEAKSERAKILFNDRDSVFKRESKNKKGLWVVVGDESPVKSGSIMKCSFKRRKTPSFPADALIGTDVLPSKPSMLPVLSSEGTNVLPSTPSMLLVPSSEDQIIFFEPIADLESSLTASDVENLNDISALENISHLDTSQRRVSNVDYASDSSSTDMVNSSREDYGQNIKSVSRMIKKKKVPSQSMPEPQPKKRCVTSDSNKENRILPAVSLPNSFKLPTRYRPDIQKKLEDPSAVFMTKDQSAFLREVANATQVYSYKPSQFEVNNIVVDILLKFPHVSSLTSPEAKHNDVTYKFKRILERRRTEARRSALVQPKKTTVKNCGPRKDPPSVPDDDEVSYGQNVSKMMEIFEKRSAPYSNAVDALVKTTFSRRRVLVREWLPESGNIENFIDLNCLFLKFQTFLFLEFELITKKSCEGFQDVWSASSKYIVEAAKTTGKKKVNSILSSDMYKTMTPELYSRAALELLPFLTPGKGRGERAARHLVDFRLESANLEKAIQQETRGAPFILYIGSTINIILESKPFMRVRTTAEAVIALMATYYVFHLDYSDKVSNALLFIQSFVLGEKDNSTESCAPVHTFSALIEKMKTSCGNK